MDAYLRFGWDHLPGVTAKYVKDAPPALRGLRLVFAADFHVRWTTTDEYLSALMDIIMNAGADMLLLGGDYGEDADSAARLCACFDRARFPLGIFGVPGNNDREVFSDLNTLRAFFPGELLINSSRSVRIGGCSVIIGGVDEYLYGKPDASGLFKARSNTAYTILLSHHPHFPKIVNGGRPRLILSGHTHGGQVNFLGLSPYTFKMEKHIVQHVRGEISCGVSRMLISNGIGTSRFPVRFGARPDVIVVEFL